MRLFKQTAYFITLIIATISEIKIFMLMLIIMMTAFANLFYVLNNNTTKESYSYVDERTKNKFVDSFISMFLIALGEFSLDGYGSGEDKLITWIFFILASFLMLVVFMNMLIAIMGDTFGRVQMIKEENSLMEQVNLMQDHIWLLDLNEVFANKRHIILLTPDSSVNQTQADI